MSSYEEIIKDVGEIANTPLTHREVLVAAMVAGNTTSKLKEKRLDEIVANFIQTNWDNITALGIPCEEYDALCAKVKGTIELSSLESRFAEFYFQIAIRSEPLTSELLEKKYEKAKLFKKMATEKIGDLFNEEKQKVDATYKKIEELLFPKTTEEEMEQTLNVVDEISDEIVAKAEKTIQENGISRKDAYKQAFDEICLRKKITGDDAKMLVKSQVDVKDSMSKLASSLEVCAKMLKSF